MYVRFENDTWENSSPTISVVTPIYNRCSTIKLPSMSITCIRYQKKELTLLNDALSL